MSSNGQAQTNVSDPQATGQQADSGEERSDLVRDYQLDFSRMLYMQHMGVDGSIRQADLKAQVIFGVSAVLITAMTEGSIGDLTLIFDASAQLGIRAVLVIKLTVMVLLLGSVFFSILAVIPRFRRSNAGSALFFFSNIIADDEQTYIDRYNSMTTYEVKDAIISQIHAKSYIVDAKFRRVQTSLLMLMAALVLWGVQYLIPV